ncbi:hypothetical protein LCGC14_1526840, partial [marine sediment metagenome]
EVFHYVPDQYAVVRNKILTRVYQAGGRVSTVMNATCSQDYVVVLLVQQLLRIMNKAVRSKRLRGIFSLVANNEVRAWIVCTRDLIRAIEKGL